MSLNVISHPKKISIIIKSICIVLLLIIPHFVSNYIISVLTTCFLFAAFAVCWNMISGYGGQISWCHAAFVSIGAYTTMIMYHRWAVSPLISLPVGMLIAFIVSTLIGKISFRYRGPFFSITTIAFAEIVRVLLLYFNEWTGGAAGLTIPFTGVNAWNLMFDNDKSHLYISMVVLAIVILITMKVERSRTGYYLRAIKGDEDAAISLGINTGKTKLRTFQLSAVLTSAIGTFYIAFLTFAQPNGIAGLDFSIKIGSVAIIGGIGTVWGPVIGAFVLIPLIEITNALLGEQGGAQLLYGLALILIVVLQPEGVMFILKKLFVKIKVSKIFEE